ncbi:tetratricopeptide repeat protein [Desulforhopalus vacuolatus]|uniref:tetratricopeptide repeat protein n=1 Tax=Desulforhopalus vacuolatus TaxID=40414 RepID=UPI00196660C4|nr:tetratricopeptide repeat protein [Desulforhopalus vacuolatus]MBM9519953.1 tetratricopeptide repeat protein [Desulforhopalus vacuolatus]
MKSVCTSFLLLPVACALSCMAAVSVGGVESVSGIVPDRELVIMGDAGRKIPGWMVEWQTARQLVREGKLEQAAKIYGQLAGEHPEVETALWEYCQVLQVLGRYEEAGRLVDILLDTRPASPEYRMAAGHVALKRGEWSRAAEAFGFVLERDPGGIRAGEAREGLAASLRGEGRKDLSLSLEEQQLAPDPSVSKSLRLRLLDDAIAVGDVRRIRWLLQPFSDYFFLSDQQLTALLPLVVFAEGDENTGRKEAQETISKAARSAGTQVNLRLLREYLRHHPGDLASRQHLVTLLKKEKDFRQALQVLEEGVETVELDRASRDSLQLAAADLAAAEADRPDAALHHYESCLRYHPGSRRVEKSVALLQDRLARDFLVIVENDGAAPLWQDMERFGCNRESIFLRMAGILVDRGRSQDYNLAVDLLNIINRHLKGDPATSRSLAQLYQRMKKWGKALAVLREVPAKRRRATWFKEQAALETELGQELAAANSWSQYLQINPDDDVVRCRALVIFASLGLVEEQERLFSVWQERDRQVDLDTVLLHLYWLGRNQQLDSMENIATWATGRWQEEPEKQVRIRLTAARALSEAGAFGRADLHLRETLNHQVATDETLLELAMNAARAGRSSAMAGWLESVPQLKSRERALSDKTLVAAGHFIRTRDALARREKDVAQEELAKGLKALRLLEKKNKADDFPDWQFPRTLLADICSSPWNGGVVLTNQCHDAKLRYRLAMVQPGMNYLKDFPEDSLSFQLADAERSIRKRDYSRAAELLKKVVKAIPHSFFAGFLEARANIGLGKFPSARKLLGDLEEGEYDADMLCREQISLDTLAGEHDTALLDFYRCYGGLEGNTKVNNEELSVHLFLDGQVEEAATLARLLWTAERYGDALSVYRAILDVPMVQIVTTHLKQGQVRGMEKQEESSWGFLDLLHPDTASEEEALASLLAPSLLLGNLGSSVGVLLARDSGLLKMQLRLIKEYDARIAIYERRYLYAEKRYQNLLEEDASVQTMADLAAVYERMGQYRKEARLYRNIENSGGVSKSIADSMARNSLNITPQVGLDFSLHSLDGVKRWRNIEDFAFGSTFSFIHEQDKEISVHYAGHRFRAVHGDNSINSNSIGSDVTWQPGNSTELQAGFTFDKLQDGFREGSTNVLFNLQIERQLNEQVSGFLRCDRTEITDTVDAIADKILANNFLAGLEVQTPNGIGFGGDMRYTSRSDSNNGIGFHTWIGWSLFHEKSEWSLRWENRFEDNDQACEDSDIDLTTVDDLGIVSYWSPVSWNEQMLNARYQYNFGGFGDVETGLSPERNHVSVNIGAGLEDDENMIYSGGLDISLEISRHFLLKSNFGFKNSRDCDFLEVSTALQYRW